MSSAWTDSLIDWDNIQDNRLESVIYHIYHAIRERDYWYRFLSNYRNGALNIESEKWRSINQLNYIYRTLTNWFLDYSSYNALAPTNDNLLGKSVFVNTDNTADGSATSMYLGKENIDLTKLGLMLDRDLTYIPNGVTTDRFVQLSNLKDFYDILKLDLQSRCFFFYVSDTFILSPQILNPRTFLDGNSLIGFRERLCSGGDPSFNEAVADFNACDFNDFNLNVSMPRRLNRQQFFIFQRDSGYTNIYQNLFYWDFELIGNDGIKYYPLDFNTYSYTYTTTPSDNYPSDIPDTIPALISGETLYTTETVIGNGLPTNQYTPRPRMGIDKAIVTETTVQDYFVEQQAMPFISLNKEGFLKYYTPTTN